MNETFLWRGEAPSLINTTFPLPSSLTDSVSAKVEMYCLTVRSNGLCNERIGRQTQDYVVISPVHTERQISHLRLNKPHKNVSWSVWFFNHDDITI